MYKTSFIRIYTFFFLGAKLLPFEPSKLANKLTIQNNVKKRKETIQ